MNTHGITQILIKLMEREAKKPQQGKPGLVKMSPAMLVIGILCTALFSIPGIILPLVTGEWSGENLFFLLFALGSSTLIIAYRNCRIWYNPEGFTVRFFLGDRKTFSYAEIESLDPSPMNEKLRVCRCTVRVGELPVGKREFLAFAKKQYRIAHGGKAIPEAPAPKWDIFNGHVDNPGEFLFVFLVMTLFLPVMLVVFWFIVDPTPMNELLFVSGQVQILGVEERDLLICCDGKELEIWGYERTLTDPEAFQKACRRDAVFTLGYRQTVNDDGEITSLCVESITDSRNYVWLTPKAAKEYRFVSISGLFAVMELILLAYCGFSIYIGRNPQKFSKKVIRLFFKDGYVH